MCTLNTICIHSNSHFTITITLHKIKDDDAAETSHYPIGAPSTSDSTQIVSPCMRQQVCGCTQQQYDIVCMCMRHSWLQDAQQAQRLGLESWKPGWEKWALWWRTCVLAYYTSLLCCCIINMLCVERTLTGHSHHQGVCIHHSSCPLSRSQRCCQGRCPS